MEQEQEKKLKELKVWRERLRHRAFMMMIEMLVIIGVPALVGFFLGRFLMQNYGLGKWAQVLTLLVCLVFSWIVIIARYKRFDRELKSVSQEISNMEKDKTDQTKIDQI